MQLRVHVNCLEHSADLSLDVQLVESEYEELYPGEVAAVHLVHDNRPLRKMQGEYHAVLQSLLDLIDRYASRRARQKPVKRKTVRMLPHARPCCSRENQHMHRILCCPCHISSL